MRIEANGNHSFTRDIGIIDTADVRIPCLTNREIHRKSYLYLDLSKENLTPDIWRVWIPYGSMLNQPVEDADFEFEDYCWVMSCDDDVGLALLRVQSGYQIIEERNQSRRYDWGSRTNNLIRSGAGEG